MEKFIKICGNAQLEVESDGIVDDKIKLEYYKICDNKNENSEKLYGIGVIKTYCDEIETNIEKREFNNIFSKENDADNMLNLLMKNKVTPITLRDILEDFVLV